MTRFSCFLIEILVRVQVCDCAAYYGPFRNQYFNLREGFLRTAPLECRNM